MKRVALSPQELETFLASHQDDITELALSQPVMAVRYDLGYGRQIVLMP